jgi:5-methyltetrahydrofolate corrinoid/iron sulfur protein methyltransferase
MMKKDKGPIQEIATRQWKEGSGVIDANIGPAEDGGEELMQWMVTTIQEVVPLPVCLDTTNFSAIEAGLKIHNNQWGKPMINSTSNDPERFPILELGAKYNCDVIGLTVGKGGLPADAEERAAIAAEIMGRAMEYGLPLENLYLDPLVLQIATTQDQVRHVIEAVKLFQHINEPPMKTIVGLSNVSNGCPKVLRPILNKVLFVLLEDAGLTAAIADAKEMAEVQEDRALILDVLAGKEIEDKQKMVEIRKTLDVILGNTLYAHSYLEM